MKYHKSLAVLSGLFILTALVSYQGTGRTPASSGLLRDSVKDAAPALESMDAPSKIVQSLRQNDRTEAAAAPMPIKSPATKGKVLVVLSSEDKITLKDSVVHPTGFFLSELMVPLKKILDAGYEPVFANPKGNKAVMDKVSDGAFWFGDAPGASPEVKQKAGKEFKEIRGLCESLGVCGQGNVGSKDLQRLAHVISAGLDQYAGVLIPGGHAPMEDLWKDKELGVILRHFHAAQKPTATICHGPISLLAGMSDPEGYIAALTKADAAAQKEKSRDWIYAGYSLTVFTTPEEKQEEPGADNALGGFVRFYPDQALQEAGAEVSRAQKWTGNVVVDRELITGQNPMSDGALGEALVKALIAKSRE
jgi:putative intracellular protease/amidase